MFGQYLRSNILRGGMVRNGWIVIVLSVFAAGCAAPVMYNHFRADCQGIARCAYTWRPGAGPLDKTQRTEQYSSADCLANQGVPTMNDANHTIVRNTVIVIDGELVITGSFNFTKTAQEKNAENVLIIRDQGLAAEYTRNWEAHRQHSQPYTGRGGRQSWQDTGHGRFRVLIEGGSG